jgi:hypothetical protein
MKHFLIIALSFLATTAFSQNWKEYIIDSNLTLNFPENYTITDTMNQKVIMAQLNYGLEMITAMENKDEFEIAVTDENDLRYEYKRLRKEMLRSAKGKLKAEEPLTKDGVIFWNFSYSARMGDVKQTRYCQILLLNKHIYTINFWEAADKSQEMAPFREKFFSSVVVPKGLGIANQLNLIDEKTAADRVSKLIGTITIKLLFGTALILLLVSVWRKVKKTRK